MRCSSTSAAASSSTSRRSTAALGDGRLGGAGLDVFTPEPLPADDALWDLPNVIVTPHNSGTSDGTAHRAAEIFLDNLRADHRRARAAERGRAERIVEPAGPGRRCGSVHERVPAARLSAAP